MTLYSLPATDPFPIPLHSKSSARCFPPFSFAHSPIGVQPCALLQGLPDLQAAGPMGACGQRAGLSFCGLSVSSLSCLPPPTVSSTKCLFLTRCSPLISLLSVQIPPKSLSPTHIPSLNSSLKGPATTALGHPIDSDFHSFDAELQTHTLSTPAKGSSLIASISPDGSGCGHPPLLPQSFCHHQSISEPAPALRLRAGACPLH